MMNDKQLELQQANRPSIPTAAYILTLCVGVIGSNSLVLGPIAPEVAQTLHASIAQVMFASSAFGLGTAASALLLAHHIDRVGAYQALKLSLLVLLVGLLLSALSPSIAVLIFAQLVVGLASGIALPSIYSMAISVAPTGSESKTLSIVLTGWTLSMIAGVSLSVVISEQLGWRAVYGAVTILSLFAWYVLNRMNVSDSPISHSTPPPISVLHLKGIKSLLICCWAFMAAFYGMYGILGDYLHHGLKLPIIANSLIALFYGVGFGAAVLLDGLRSHVSTKKLLPITLVVIALVYLVVSLSGKSLDVIYTILFVLGVANHFAVNLLITRLTAIKPDKKGSIMGLYSAVTYFGVFAGTSIFGLAYSQYGFAFAAMVAMALTLFSALACCKGFYKAQYTRRAIFDKQRH